MFIHVKKKKESDSTKEKIKDAFVLVAF